ncbi:MAG TPA: SET domain-containing protein-lysine N-methyltransferase [Puia sp.]
MLDIFRLGRVYQPEGIVFWKSLIHGQGVFAEKGFKARDTVEIAPLILLSKGEREALRATLLFNYYFIIGPEEGGVAVGLGYSSLYNHSYSANAIYSISEKRALITIRAFRDILPGEEITLNYNGEPDDLSPVYFP